MLNPDDRQPEHADKNVKRQRYRDPPFQKEFQPTSIARSATP